MIVLSNNWATIGLYVCLVRVILRRDNTVQAWNVSYGSNVFTCRGYADTVLSVAWSPDGKRIVSGSSDETVQVWNANDGSNVFTYTGHSSSVDAVAWSPDGNYIASGSYDKTMQV